MVIQKTSQTEGLILPDFLGIGAVKTGTTWLYRNLYQHPEIFLPIKKPVFFFDKNFDKGLDGYSRIFRKAGDRLIGEFTASYSTLPLDRIRFIRGVMPKAKFIFLMRHPIYRDWSDARMELSVIQERDPSDITHDDLLSEIQTKQCRDRGNYLQILKNWFDVYPREQFFIGTYEDMFSRPRAFLAEIFAFLGVTSSGLDWDQYPIGDVIFKGANIQLPADIQELLDARYPLSYVETLGQFLGMDFTTIWKYKEH